MMFFKSKTFAEKILIWQALSTASLLVLILSLIMVNSEGILWGMPSFFSLPLIFSLNFLGLFTNIALYKLNKPGSKGMILLFLAIFLLILGPFYGLY